MNMIYVILPVALAIGVAAVIACVWAIRSGQFDDAESQGTRMLLDDDGFDEQSP